jgi:lipopolysaccharide export system protein LptA
VWTPKRTLLLAAGFTLFVTAYVVYAYSPLGGIDGLPPLPPGLSEAADDPNLPPLPPRINTVDQKLQTAFHGPCREVNWPIKLDLRSRGIVLAAEQCVFEPDGRVKLQPFSIAIFGKDNAHSPFPEINTVRSNFAYLTFDRPIRHATEIGNRKITHGELVGAIQITNNRRSPQQDDDILIHTPGPIHYAEDRHLIWTESTVQLRDHQSQPEPMVINAEGLELKLTVENSSSRSAAARKSKPDTISGVEEVLLKANVAMFLYLDDRSTFPGTGKAVAAAEGEKPATPSRTRVVIDTQGPFHYDVAKERAQFNISQKPGNRYNRVVVTRFHDKDMRDVLDCEQLVLQFRRKPAGKSSREERKDERAVNLEIESAHATGREVILTSDPENLEAHGNDFFYEARTGLSTLKGNPGMWAVQEGNEIHARELQLLHQKGAHQATALGPGTISLLDKSNGKRPLHARWKDKLVTVKDGPHDLLTLSGDAAFLDDDHLVLDKPDDLFNDQVLHRARNLLKGESLKVWLLARPAAAAAGTADSVPQRGRRPHHLEATGKVLCRSPEMNIANADRLVVWFKDAPAKPVPVAATSSEHVVNKPPAAATVADTVPAPGPSSPLAGVRLGSGDRSQKPIDLSARSVEAFVLRAGTKNELEQLWTEGEVHVHQEPATPEEKGVDITGDTLKLTHKSEGNFLVVTGNLARLQLDKLLIVGPEVNIDQASNRAWVNGGGHMVMETNTNFQGGKLNRPVPLRITWDEAMLFNGNKADFYGGSRGGIQAVQENARLLCQALQVYLDRSVSLQGGDKKGQPPARVQSLLCDKNVSVEDTEEDRGRFLKYQRIEAAYLSLDNAESQVIAAGPGYVRILQRGGPDPLAAPPGPTASGSPPTDELKLTYVKYGDRLWANNRDHRAIFYENVEVFHFPAKGSDRNLVPNVERLPQGAMHLTCDKLDVVNRPQKEGANQQMKASGRVVVRLQDFWARADEVSYDQALDQLILTAKAGSVVDLRRRPQPGGRVERSAGQQIIYNRKTGELMGKGIRSMGFDD